MKITKEKLEESMNSISTGHELFFNDLRTEIISSEKFQYYINYIAKDILTSTQKTKDVMLRVLTVFIIGIELGLTYKNKEEKFPSV